LDTCPRHTEASASARLRRDRPRHRGLGFRVTALVCLVALAGAMLVAQVRVPVPGDALPGITPVEFQEFRLGLDDFLEVETSDEGLGPAFNATSCAVCHSVPAVGGTSAIAEVRAGKRGPNGEFIPLDASGESLFHLFSVPGHACQPVIPADATIIVRRVPIPVFGAGLVEAIPDEALLALEDPSDRNRDGVSGRAAMVTDLASGERRVGRFGWKAQHARVQR
jgi:Di-haem oxidoreductase, putative peroxidase